MVEVDTANIAVLSGLLTTAFGIEHARTPEQLLDELSDPKIKYYIAVLAGIPIGQIGAVIADSGVYIRGFGILPEHRRRGYGRQLLGGIVARLYDESEGRFALDVETDNAGALSLYRSCAFEESLIYDYYRVV